MEPKFDKRFIDEAVQEVVKDIKQNYVPKKVLNEITREEAINAFKEWIERDKKIEYADRLENIEIYKLAIKALEAENVLDKIIAEIKQLKTYDRYTGESYLACEFMEDVLHIIDKYKVESEEVDE